MGYILGGGGGGGGGGCRAKAFGWSLGEYASLYTPFSSLLKPAALRCRVWDVPPWTNSP